MIHSFINKFNDIERDIEVLSYILLVFLLFLGGRISFFIYMSQYEELWSLLSPLITVISVLIVTKSANRLIVSSKIIREDERRIDLVRTTHHLIAVTQDFQQKIMYLKKLLSADEVSPVALIEVSKSIQSRYETLYEREIYKHLPGKCVNIITAMSGSIYGLGVFSTGVESILNKKPANKLFLPNNPPIENLDILNVEVSKLIDELFTIRESIKE